MAFLTMLGVTEVLSSFRLVLKRKTGKEIPGSARLEFLEKFSANNFAEIGNKKTIDNSQKVPRATFLESDGLFCLISICIFSSFKNLFAAITSLSELYFRLRRFILLVQMKIMNYAGSTYE